MLDRNEMMIPFERQQPQAMMPYMPAAMPPYMPQPEPEEPSLLAGIFRHLWIVVVVVGVMLIGACIFLNRTTPLYRSTSGLLITANGPVGEGMQSSQGGGNYLGTQCKLMKSPIILNSVIARPDIANLPLFKGIRSPLLYIRENLEADPGRTDDIITVAISTPDPVASATIVNAVVDAYQLYQADSKSRSVGNILETLQKESQAKHDEIQKKEAEIETLRANNPLALQADGQASSPAMIRENVLASKYADISANRSNLASIYPNGNPQLEQLKREEKNAFDLFVAAQNDYIAVDKVHGEFAKAKSDLQELKEVVKPLDERINHLQEQRDMFQQITSAFVTAPAEVIGRPTFPSKSTTFVLAVAVGLVIGGFLAFLRDRTDGRLRTAEEVQQFLGMPILGVVPRMPGRRTAVARAMAVHLDPRSETSEAYRTIRTAVYFSAQGTSSRTLLVTSPEAGDGKTTSASNLAIAIAQTGRSVLLLDADFRKPTQHKNLDIKDSVGLSSVLSGTETLDRAIQRTGVEGLDILPCGAIPGNPSEILNSQEFGELVDRLAMKYDHIIFDSPPVNLVTDARILGAVCDATVLVLRAEKSTRKAAEHARNALLSVGAKVLGIIVNDASRGRGYDNYGGSYYGTSGMQSKNGYSAAPMPPTTPGPMGYISRVPRTPADASEG